MNKKEKYLQLVSEFEDTLIARTQSKKARCEIMLLLKPIAEAYMALYGSGEVTNKDVTKAYRELRPNSCLWR